MSRGNRPEDLFTEIDDLDRRLHALEKISASVPLPGTTIKTFHLGHTFAIGGVVNAGEEIPTFYVPMYAGQSTAILNAIARVNNGSPGSTSVAFKLQRNGADIGYGTTAAPLISDSPTKTKFTHAVSLADEDEIRLVIVGVVGVPISFTVTLTLEHIV